MTDAQAKAIGVKSARKGRKQARDLVVRVVSYFIDSYTGKLCQMPRAALEADIKKALLDVGHPARTYENIDAFVERTLSESILDRELDKHKFQVNM
jgi:hypothetical protein